MSKFEKMEKEIREFHKLWLAEYIAKTIEVKHRIYKKVDVKYAMNTKFEEEISIQLKPKTIDDFVKAI